MLQWRLLGRRITWQKGQMLSGSNVSSSFERLTFLLGSMYYDLESQTDAKTARSATKMTRMIVSRVI